MTLIKDQLMLPLPAALGFAELLLLMFVLVWLAARYHRKHAHQVQTAQGAPA